MPAMSILKRFRPAILGVSLLTALSGCLSVGDAFDGVALLTVITGNEQNVVVNTAAAVPLVVRAYDNNADPIEGVDVSWSVSGTGTVTPSSSTTDATGSATASFTAGSTTGPTQVRATADGLTVTFTFTVIAGT